MHTQTDVPHLHRNCLRSVEELLALWGFSASHCLVSEKMLT